MLPRKPKGRLCPVHSVQSGVLHTAMTPTSPKGKNKTVRKFHSTNKENSHQITVSGYSDTYTNAIFAPPLPPQANSKCINNSHLCVFIS